MKRYEKMSKEEIIEVLMPQSSCTKCVASGELCINKVDGRKTCAETIHFWLNEEVDTKPRILTVKVAKDVDSLIEKFKHLCHSQKYCSVCKYRPCNTTAVGPLECLKNYLKEEIEVSSDEQTR